MARRPLVIDIPALGAIDRNRGAVGRQLADALRSAVTREELSPGERLPSTRTLADSLGLARGTVANAYEQLIAEGCLEARAGSGTLVAGKPVSLMLPSVTPSLLPDRPPAVPRETVRYAALAKKLTPLPSRPFSVAVPEGDVALDKHWRRLARRLCASQAAAPSGYPDPQGLPALRSVIADYLLRARAVRCSADNLTITEGTQQGLYLAAKVLLQAGDTVWAEDPVYSGLTAVLDDRGVRTRRIPVDIHGLDVERATTNASHARAAFVTPSHQYPLGMPLSMPRRLALVDWARKHGGWIVEDDYDSELRYAGQPFPALQGLAPDRVVYLGTFSKVLAPSLRLGYIVVPEALTKAFVGVRALLGRGSASFEQHLVATFMREGFFETHIRRIRAHYAARREILLNALGAELPQLRIQPADQGMHIVVWLPDGVSDVALASAASQAGISVRALSPMCSERLKMSGLMLGFGGFTAAQLESSVRMLRDVLENGLQT